MEETKQELSKIDFDKFRQYIESRTGIYIDDSKQGSFQMNLDTRMDILGIHDYAAYYSLIVTNTIGRKEFDELLNLLLIKETSFFRDSRQLSVLTKNILPELIRRKKQQEIKIWSAGCATGEEPYSIVMAIMESFLPDSVNVSVYATDISEETLKRAKEGIYSKSSMRTIDSAMLQKYFTRRDGRYCLNEQIKRPVRFETVNLVEPYSPVQGVSFDIIFCKNVIIYFRTETIKRVIRKFYDVLTDGGYLFLGHSESLWQISDDFELEEISGIFLYRKDRKSKAAPSSIKRFRKWESTSEDIVSVLQRRLHSVKERVTRYVAPAKPEGTVKNLPPCTGLMHKKDALDRIIKGVLPPDDNKYEELLEDIERVLQEEPRNINAHVLAGKTYANMGLYDKAFKKGQDALEIDDLSANAYVLLGSIYYKTSEKEKAIAAFKKAIYLDDTSILSHYYLGNLYKDTFHTEQAVNEYKHVIRIFEAHPESKEWLVGEVFTAEQLKEICVRNIELLTSNKL